jgi:U3 small nucleolar RNA-associated protein 14
MPGRQAHGRPLLSTKSAVPRNRQSRSRATAKALDAYGAASEAVPEKRKRLRTRDLDVEPVRKRARAAEDSQDDDEYEESEDNEGPGMRKRRKAPRRGQEEELAESDFGSDSEGHEWQVGQGRGDDDSDIDSDEAFGEGDEERFEGYVFGGSASEKPIPGASGNGLEGGGEEEDDDFGEDAIDLADALDQSSGSEEGSGSGSESLSEEDGGSSFGGLSEDDDEDRSQKLQNLALDFAGTDGADAAPGNAASAGRARVSLSDLGLDNVKDREMRKSLKLLAKEEKAASKPGSGQRLDVPLARRQQDRLLRIAATEKANATLDRWTETVKHNRRADHLIFPLQQQQTGGAPDNSELAPIKEKAAGSKLEQSIMAIMQESGLLPTEGEKKQLLADDDPTTGGISRADFQKEVAQRRREREMHSREQARAKKIKKIKSKAWHRVHRREKARVEMAEQEAAAANGELNSEEEAEAQDRRRAMERVGARHRESKWAKAAARTGRAVWDEEFREGIKDMVRKDEELRKRVEGRGIRGADAGDEEDEDSNDEASGDDEDAERRRLLRQIEEAKDELDDAPQSRLMAMPFMQRAEAAIRKENNDMIAQIRRELDSEAESDDADAARPEEVGRRSFGLPKKVVNAEGAEDDEAFNSDDERFVVADEEPASKPQPASEPVKKKGPELLLEASEPELQPRDSTHGAWSQKLAQDGPKGRKRKTKKVVELDLDLSGKNLVAPVKKAEKLKLSVANDEDASSDSEAEITLHHPLALRDQELVKRAFADDDAIGTDFAREKAAMASDDEEKTIDNTLPGWGSWVGEGVSERDRQRHKGRFLTKVDAVKKKADRRDAKLDKVIISERRVRKNERYLASALPFPFENKSQYEQSLRLPVGQEWMTKESFQSATKPRVIVKQGIIAPMARPIM